MRTWPRHSTGLTMPGLLAAIGSFPGQGMIRDWLKAGVFEPGKGFAPTEEGTPQGGVISPLLLNVALHGLEEAAGVRYERVQQDADRLSAGSPVVIRYADDMVALCHCQRQAEQVKAKLADGWRPGALPSTRTRRGSSTSTTVSTSWGSTSAAITASCSSSPARPPSDGSGNGSPRKCAPCAARNAAVVLATIIPITRGWAPTTGAGSSKEAIHQPGRLHVAAHLQVGLPPPPDKPKTWIISRYFGRFNKARQDRWVFGDRDSGAYLPKFAWTKIVRHLLVTGTASPDDPAQASYWAERRRKKQAPARPQHPAPAPGAERPLPAMRGPALHADREPQSPQQWEQWHRHPQGDHQAQPHRRRDGAAGRHPSRARILPPPGNRRAQGPSTLHS